ncbi:HGxxPAAW family protein [Streptomyces sp. NPDC002573]|uniref:HGxxPAAW family protein n=1 Tax=Streptomyces sp. NPDC002573 TaxID=3364651 RepID=UPI0036CAF4F7
MSEHGHEEGHTLAGWTGCVLATAGALLIGAGICGWRAGIWPGLGLVVVSVLATWFLHLAGWGKPPGLRPVDQRGMRARDLSARRGHANCLGCRLAGRGAAPASQVPETAVGGSREPAPATDVTS